MPMKFFIFASPIVPMKEHAMEMHRKEQTIFTQKKHI
jgi:hypothetical protein